MTGMTLLGGTYAYEGEVREVNGQKIPIVGYDAERARVVEFAKNKDLMRMGNIGKTFRPVEGTFHEKGSLWAKDDISVDNEFIMDDGDSFYWVVFNYGNNGATLEKTPDFARLGINPAEYVSVKELWEGKTFEPGSLKASVPSKDVRIYRFDKDSSGVAETMVDDMENSVVIGKSGNGLQINANSSIDKVEVYSIEGISLKSVKTGGAECSLGLSLDSANGVVIVKVTLENGYVKTAKLSN